ncbi:hypothetical protein Q3G72_013980 [Acer saccharum]|nr:hypothetical protein Q3G72_013980 [Acer saccharum]
MNNNSHVLPSSSSRQTQLPDEMARMHIENEHEERVRVDRVLDVCRCTICLQTWASHGDRQFFSSKFMPLSIASTNASAQASPLVQLCLVPYVFVKGAHRCQDGVLRQTPPAMCLPLCLMPLLKACVGSNMALSD